MVKASFNETTCVISGHLVEAYTAFVGNEPCNGRGECIDGRCECRPFYSGLSDMSNWDGIGCHNPLILQTILWSAVLVGWTFVWIITLSALNQKTKEYRVWVQHNQSSKRKLGPKDYFPFHILVPMGLFAQPAIIIVACLKLSGQFAIGVHWVPTLLFVVAIITSFTCALRMQTKQFSTVTKGTVFGSTTDGRDIAVNFKRRALQGNILYGISKVIMFCSLFVQPQGPFSSSVFGIIILQNGLSLIYFIWFGSMAHKVVRKVSIMLAETPSSNSAKSDLEEVLNFMMEAATSNQRTTWLLGVLYISFSSPWFIGYLTYMFSAGLLLTLPSSYRQSKLFLGGRKLNDAAKSKQDRRYSDGVTLKDIGLDGDMAFNSFMMNDSPASRHTPSNSISSMKSGSMSSMKSKPRSGLNLNDLESPPVSLKRETASSGQAAAISVKLEDGTKRHIRGGTASSGRGRSGKVGSGKLGSARVSARSSGRRKTNKSRMTDKTGVSITISSDDHTSHTSMNPSLSHSSLQRTMSL